MGRVIVIGDIMLDVSYVGTANRIAQESCVPILNIDEQQITYSLGGAANVYQNLVNLNVDAQILSCIGNDNYGLIFRSKVDEIKNTKNTLLCVDDSRCTTVKHRFYTNNKMIFRYDTENTHEISYTIENTLFEKFESEMNETIHDAIIISDYDKGVLTESLMGRIMNYAKIHHIKVFVDPKPKCISKYFGSYLIKPNRIEGERICKTPITIDNMISMVKLICEKTQCDNCLLTLGNEGMILYQSETKDVLYVDTCHDNIIDITGAGDIVFSGLIYSYLNGVCLLKSIDFANYCGQLKVRHFGTYNISLYDVLNYNLISNKYVERENCDDIMSIIKRANKSIVFTNGCFDILHYGHLRLLESAKHQGDILIVGLNTDKSIKINKGDDRPINTLNTRIKQLSALKCVDIIFSFEEETPYELIKQIQPDTLVKGGDYNIDNIVGKDIAKNTIIVQYVAGFSSTNIISQIQTNDNNKKYQNTRS